MTVRVGPPDDGSTVVVPRGDTLEVVLPQNAATGYRWELSPSAGLVVVDDFVSSPPLEHPGASGDRVLVLRVDEPGIVHAELRRPWLPAQPAARSYTVRVRTD